MRNSKFWETPPSTALRDLAHRPVAFFLISVLAFCCRVSHTTTIFGDEKSLSQSSFERERVGQKQQSVGRPWFSCVLGVKVQWFSGCYSGSLDPIVQASFTRSFCVASTDYQRFSASLKLMTSQVVQSARPLTGRICPLRPQRVKTLFTYSFVSSRSKKTDFQLEVVWKNICKTAFIPEIKTFSRINFTSSGTYKHFSLGRSWKAGLYPSAVMVSSLFPIRSLE